MILILSWAAIGPPGKRHPMDGVPWRTNSGPIFLLTGYLL